jgi:hypothetical protein
MSALLEASNSQKSQLEDTVALLKSTTQKYDAKVKASIAEIHKGNSYIDQLTTELQASKSKVKLKSAIARHQEQQLHEKDVANGNASQEASNVRVELVRHKSENETLQAALDAANVKIEDVQKQLQSNQQVISWLNKEVNDAQLGRRPVCRRSDRMRMICLPAPTRLAGCVTHGRVIDKPNAVLAGHRLHSWVGDTRFGGECSIPIQAQRRLPVRACCGCYEIAVATEHTTDGHADRRCTSLQRSVRAVALVFVGDILAAPAAPVVRNCFWWLLESVSKIDYQPLRAYVCKIRHVCGRDGASAADAL